jgi:hypothetical protein
VRSEAQEFGLGKNHEKRLFRIRFFSSHPPHQTAATSANGLNGPRTGSGGLNGALADKWFELTKMIYPTCWLKRTR